VTYVVLASRQATDDSSTTLSARSLPSPISLCPLFSSPLDSFVLLASDPFPPPPSSSLPGGPVHKAGTVSQAAGHPVTRRGPFEVFENANSRDRTPNEISRCVQPRAVSLFPLSSLTPHCDDASHARIRVKVENDYELRGILPQARNYSLLARTVYSYISFSLGRRTSCFYEDYLPLRPNHTYSIRIWLLCLYWKHKILKDFCLFLPI